MNSVRICWRRRSSVTSSSTTTTSPPARRARPHEELRGSPSPVAESVGREPPSARPASTRSIARVEERLHDGAPDEPPGATSRSAWARALRRATRRVGVEHGARPREEVDRRVIGPDPPAAGSVAVAKRRAGGLDLLGAAAQHEQRGTRAARRARRTDHEGVHRDPCPRAMRHQREHAGRTGSAGPADVRTGGCGRGGALIAAVNGATRPA